MEVDKIAEIRREVEERAAANTEAWEGYEYLSHCPDHVVIYGVPLNEGEIETLRQCIAAVRDDWEIANVSALREMLERGKK